MKKALPCLALFVLGLVLGWLVAGRSHPGEPASSENRRALVVYPSGDKARSQPLTVNRIRKQSGGDPIDFAPVDLDTDWYIEIGGVSYWCSPRPLAP